MEEKKRRKNNKKIAVRAFANPALFGQERQAPVANEATPGPVPRALFFLPFWRISWRLAVGLLLACSSRQQGPGLLPFC
jgi:hypothetical protein